MVRSRQRTFRSSRLQRARVSRFGPHFYLSTRKRPVHVPLCVLVPFMEGTRSQCGGRLGHVHDQETVGIRFFARLGRQNKHRSYELMAGNSNQRAPFRGDGVGRRLPATSQAKRELRVRRCRLDSAAPLQFYLTSWGTAGSAGLAVPSAEPEDADDRRCFT